MNFYISERNEACPNLSCLCSLSGVCDRARQYPPTHRNLSNGEKKGKKKKKKNTGKEDYVGKCHGKGRRVSAAQLPSCHLLHTYAGMVGRTRSQSQPLRSFCLLVIVPDTDHYWPCLLQLLWGKKKEKKKTLQMEQIKEVLKCSSPTRSCQSPSQSCSISCHPSCSSLRLCRAGFKLSTPVIPGPASSVPVPMVQVPVFVKLHTQLNTSIFATYITQGVLDPCRDPGSSHAPCIISCPISDSSIPFLLGRDRKTVPKQRSRCILSLCVLSAHHTPQGGGVNEELVISHCLHGMSER